MLRTLVLIVLSFCGSTSALEPDESDAASILIQGSLIFEVLSHSVLKLPTNKDGEYIFSFCLSKDNHWGFAAFGKSEAYRFDPVSQQIEEFNCHTAISREKVIALSDYISNTKDEESRWMIKRQRPCYPKKLGNNTVSICHEMAGCEDCKINIFWTMAEFYRGGFWLVTTVSALAGFFVYVVIKNIQQVYICPKCQYEWTARGVGSGANL